MWLSAAAPESYGVWVAIMLLSGVMLYMLKNHIRLYNLSY
jgi:hypothetical protein